MSRTVEIVMLCRDVRSGKKRLRQTYSDDIVTEICDGMLASSRQRFGGLGDSHRLLIDRNADWPNYHGYPPWTVSQEAVVGGFGHLMRYAVHSSASQAVVILCSDTPNLPLEYVVQTVSWLRDGCPVVFGPAMDGGTTIVGVQNGLESIVFKDVPWEDSSRIFSTMLNNVVSRNQYAAITPQWYDIDTVEDLRRLGNSGQDWAKWLDRIVVKNGSAT